MSKIYIVSILLLFSLSFKSSLAQWQQTNGPRGGFTTCFASDEDEIYAGTQYGGVFRTTNEGASWSACNIGLTELDVHALYNDNETIYASTGVNGLYSSSDDGASWQVVPGFWSSYAVGAIAADGANIYAGSAGGGLIVSNNGGASWSYEMVGIIPAMSYSVQKILIHSGNVFCVINGRVYISTDNGASWSVTDDGIPIATVMSLFDTGTELVAATNSAVYISSDDGQSWLETAGDLPNMPYGMIMTVTGDDFYVCDAYYEGLYHSDNGGESWTTMDFAPENNIGNIYVLNNGKLLAQTTNAAYGILPTEQPALYITNDNGLTWNDITHEITGSYCLSLTTMNNSIYAGTFGLGVFSSSDDGTTWEPLGLCYDFIQSLGSIGNTLLVGGAGVLRSTDNGITWVNSSQGLTNASISGFDYIGTDIFAATAGGVFISTNDGQSWQEQNDGNTSGAAVSILAIDLNLFVGTPNGIFMSSNFGNSWDNISTGLPPNSFVAGIDHIGTTLFISVSGYGLYASEDNGASWSNIYATTIPMELEVVGDLIFAALPPLYNVTEESVIVSNDQGLTWINASENLTNNIVTDFEVKDDFIYAATKGSGVFKRPLSDFEDQGVGQMTSMEIALYPNPANTNFTLRISSEVLGEELTIHDAIGKCVMRVNQVKTISSQIDCSGLSAGIYSVEVGGVQKKLVVE